MLPPGVSVWVCATLLPTESLLRRLFLAIMYKHDVIHKTGSTYRIATPPKENRATDIGNTHKKFFGKDQTCSSGDMLADRQTDRHGHHKYSAPLSGAEYLSLATCMCLREHGLLTTLWCDTVERSQATFHFRGQSLCWQQCAVKSLLFLHTSVSHDACFN